MENRINDSSNLDELEKARVAIFGKKGYLAQEFAKLKTIPNEQKREFAKNLNLKKEKLNQLYEQKLAILTKDALHDKMKNESIDVTLFHPKSQIGALHPITQTMNKIIDYFVSLNFSIQEATLVEDDFHNFEALNIPAYHPARDMQDTFFFNDNKLLRTHTSTVQIQVMKDRASKPPIRMISPGAVFRKDFDITHTPMFHQVEGLMVDRVGEISFANLKYILEDFLHYMFGDVKVRFRPSFFPFTEPSCEVDISCIFCNSKGCRVCSQSGWLEVLGSGMVDPNVFEKVGYKDVSGYAFGLGVERFAMLLHKVPDLRSMFEGDLRLLEQMQ